MYILSSNTLTIESINAVSQYAFRHVIDHGNGITFD